MGIGIGLYPKITINDITMTTPYTQGKGAKYDIEYLKREMFHPLKVYPVGSIYMSVDPTDPSELFGGGTWERIIKRFLLCENPKYTAYQTGATGGAYTHKITMDEMPKHAHDLPFFNNYTDYDTGEEDFKGVYGFGQTAAEACADMGVESTYEMWWTKSTTDGERQHNTADGNEPSYLTSYKGSGAAFSIMPPFVCVYMWKRIA